MSSSDILLWTKKVLKYCKYKNTIFFSIRQSIWPHPSCILQRKVLMSLIDHNALSVFGGPFDRLSYTGGWISDCPEKVWQIEFVRVLFTNVGALLSLVDKVVRALLYRKCWNSCWRNQGKIYYSETNSETEKSMIKLIIYQQILMQQIQIL